MKNDAPIDEKEQEQETPKSLLEELIREGARRLLHAVIEQEVTEYLERFRNRRMASDRRSVKLTAAIHVASIFAKDGGAICGKDDLPLTRWKKGIFWLLPGTSR